MKNISNFFSLFKNKASIEINKRLIVASILKKHINIDVDIKDIEFKNNSIYLKLSQVFKNEVFIKKPKILEEINNSIDQNIVDIR